MTLNIVFNCRDGGGYGRGKTRLGNHARSTRHARALLLSHFSCGLDVDARRVVDSLQPATFLAVIVLRGLGAYEPI